MTTTAPAAASPAASSNLTQHKESVGAWLSSFISDEAPLASATAAAIYNHFAPGLLQAFVPGQVIGDAVTKALSGLSSAVKGQVVAFSVPSGVLSDTLSYIEGVVPGTVKAIETYVNPAITAAARALGILPAAKAA